MKQFPKGTFYAFSGLFFLLTLLVMFRSEEPFGVAAVVAYFACLSLTILLLSVPYFASYFINYYRKLHQIEEAIVRITEYRQLSNLPAGDLTNEEEHPPYSAVSAIEESISPEEIRLLKENSSQVPFGSSADSDQEVDAEQISVSRRDSVTPKPPSKTTEEEDLDRGQLSLLDDMFAAAFSPEEKSIPEAETVAEEEEPSIAPTTIQAYALLDPDCNLYIRGKSPFPEPKGAKMEKLDVGKYELILHDLADPVTITFWMNNKKRSLSAEVKAEPGTVNEYYPEFQEAY